MRLACLLFSLCLLAGVCGPATASVVLTGTRIIYPAALSSKTLHFSHDDDHPWLVQVWLDAGDENSTPDTVDETIPFILNPPIFRMEPESGQAVRLMPVGTEHLPADRESLFYFNFTQFPALDADQLDDHQLIVLIRSRVKLFYRPRGLSTPDLRKLACSLDFKIGRQQVEINNPAPFHVVVSHARLRMQARTLELLRGKTLVPFSQQSWALDKALDEVLTPGDDAQLQLTLVNDYGADETYTCPWN